MFWKYEVKDELKDYNGIANAVATLPDELQQLELEFTAIRSSTSDTTPVQGGGTAYEDKLLNNIVKRGQSTTAYERAKLRKSRIDAGLSVLNPDERHILDVMYIDRQRNAVSRLCEELHLEDERSVYKRVDKALRKVVIAMYGAEEK